MLRAMKRDLALALAGGLLAACTCLSAEPPPLLRGHAHNDYEHPRPLFDALDRGFCSVEADVWLVDGELRVAHDQKDARPGKTLQRLYLDPLWERVRRNGGRVYRDVPSVTLLVDVKSDPTNTYRLLRTVLRPYARMLTRFERTRTRTNAVTVIISGNRPRELMQAEPVREAALDGRLPDLDGPALPQLIPLVSDNWAQYCQWKGRPADGPLPEADRRKLREWVDRAHRQGRRLRLWGTPDTPAAWKELADAGVDLINTDDLAGLAAFFNNRRK
jgi:hypothetical protein